MGIEEEGMITIKVAHCGQTKRTTFKKTALTFESLSDWIVSAFGLQAPLSATPTRLAYRDPEGDAISIGSNDELQEALRLTPEGAILALHLSFPRPRGERWLARMCHDADFAHEQADNNATQSVSPCTQPGSKEQQEAAADGVSGSNETTNNVSNNGGSVDPNVTGPSAHGFGAHPWCERRRGRFGGGMGCRGRWAAFQAAQQASAATPSENGANVASPVGGNDAAPAPAFAHPHPFHRHGGMMGGSHHHPFHPHRHGFGGMGPHHGMAHHHPEMPVSVSEDSEMAGFPPAGRPDFCGGRPDFVGRRRHPHHHRGHHHRGEEFVNSRPGSPSTVEGPATADASSANAFGDHHAQHQHHHQMHHGHHAAHPFFGGHHGGYHHHPHPADHASPFHSPADFDHFHHHHQQHPAHHHQFHHQQKPQHHASPYAGVFPPCFWMMPPTTPFTGGMMPPMMHPSCGFFPMNAGFHFAAHAPAPAQENTAASASASPNPVASNTEGFGLGRRHGPRGDKLHLMMNWLLATLIMIVVFHFLPLGAVFVPVFGIIATTLTCVLRRKYHKMKHTRGSNPINTKDAQHGAAVISSFATVSAASPSTSSSASASAAVPAPVAAEPQPATRCHRRGRWARIESERAESPVASPSIVAPVVAPVAPAAAAAAPSVVISPAQPKSREELIAARAARFGMGVRPAAVSIDVVPAAAAANIQEHNNASSVAAAAAPVAAAENPAVNQFRTDMQLLQTMGFSDAARNRRFLRRLGDVNAVVARLTEDSE